MQYSSDVSERKDEALRFVFSFFDAGFASRRHLPDSLARKPQVLAKLINDLGVAPKSSSTVLVSGSKGKGTTARLIAWSLQASNNRVGLVVSPEEIQHLDRIRINNRPITGDQFADIIDELKRPLLLLAKNNPEPYYHSPSDLFLLVALVWFARQKVDCFVFEGGRGVRFDLIGFIDAAVGCVTAVLPEHLQWIGPTIEDVAKDKLSLFSRCERIVLPVSLKPFADHLAPQNSHSKRRVVWLDFADESGAKKSSAKESSASDLPAWFLQNAQLARTVVQQLQCNRVGGAPAGVTALQDIEEMVRWGSPSFQVTYWPMTKTRVFLDGAIDPDCFDRRQLMRIAGPRSAVIVGLSSDKAGELMMKLLNGFPFGLIAKIEVISATSLPVQGGKSLDAYPLLGVIDLRPVTKMTTSAAAVSPELKAELFALSERYETIYFVGVQLFLKSLRAMLDLQLIGPKYNEYSMNDNVRNE